MNGQELIAAIIFGAIIDEVPTRRAEARAAELRGVRVISARRESESETETARKSIAAAALS